MRASGRGALVALAALELMLVACGGGGGDSKGAESPASVAPAPSAMAPAPAAPVPDAAATPGAPDGHPDLSAAAREPYNRGWAAWANGDLNAAKAAFTEASQKETKSPAPQYSLGVVDERLGDPSGAQQAYRAAFALNPNYEVALGAYALSLANSGHTGEADTFLADKHQRAPKSARITTYLAQVKSLEKDSGSAQQLAQDALRLDPENKEAMVVIAQDHYRARRIELALYALQAILEGFGDATPPRDKDNADAHLLRGIINKELGKRAAAMTDFEAARAKRPDLVPALLQLGVMKLEAGNSAEATPLLESASRFAPNDPIVRVNLGDAYRLAGRAADAKREFEKALSQDSSLSVAHYDLGLLYLFSPNVPGYQPPDQVAKAINELETFRTMRGRSGGSGQGDDLDDLLTRAKAKQAEMKQAAAVQPAAAPAKATPPAPPKK